MLETCEWGPSIVKRVSETEPPKRIEEKPELPFELFDPWSKRLEFDKPYRLPRIPDPPEDVSGTIH
jgi:hypothetical protein